MLIASCAGFVNGGENPGYGFYRSEGRLVDGGMAVNAGAVMGCNSYWRSMLLWSLLVFRVIEFLFWPSKRKFISA